jgi:ferredoxin
MITDMKKAKVDKSKCIGCGTCVALAGKSFKLGEDGKAQPIDPAGDEESTIQNAIDSCPVGAISWNEEASS